MSNASKAQPADPLAGISAERVAMIEALVRDGGPLEHFERHTGISTVADLRQWAEGQLRETLRLKSYHDGVGAPKDDELGDYLAGKVAVLMPLLANFRQIDKRAADLNRTRKAARMDDFSAPHLSEAP